MLLILRTTCVALIYSYLITDTRIYQLLMHDISITDRRYHSNHVYQKYIQLIYIFFFLQLHQLQLTSPRGLRGVVREKKRLINVSEHDFIYPWRIYIFSFIALSHLHSCSNAATSDPSRVASISPENRSLRLGFV